MPVAVDTAHTPALSLELCSGPENTASSVLSNLLGARRGPLLIYVKLYGKRTATRSSFRRSQLKLRNMTGLVRG